MTSPPKIPYPGFRLVFALVNATIWFGLAFGIGWGALWKLAARAGGVVDAPTMAIGAAAAALLAGGFGGPGAISGFLDMMRSGKVELPPRERWGRGHLDAIWSRSALLGVVGALLAGGASFALGPAGSVAAACARLGGVAAAWAVAVSLAISGPGALGDLARAGDAPPPEGDAGWIARRVALPQAVGNGAITALIAAGSFDAASLGVAPLAIDAAVTALVVGAFMLTTSAGLIACERRLGRVAKRSAGPTRGARAGLLLATTALAGALGAGLGATGAASLGVYVAWKLALGAAAAWVTARAAAEAALAAPDPATGA